MKCFYYIHNAAVGQELYVIESAIYLHNLEKL